LEKQRKKGKERGPRRSPEGTTQRGEKVPKKAREQREGRAQGSSKGWRAVERGEHAVDETGDGIRRGDGKKACRKKNSGN